MSAASLLGGRWCSRILTLHWRHVWVCILLRWGVEYHDLSHSQPAKFRPKIEVASQTRNLGTRQYHDELVKTRNLCGWNLWVAMYIRSAISG